MVKHGSYDTDPGDTRLFQFKHEWLLRWLTYMEAYNTEVGYFPSVVSPIPISCMWILCLKSQYKLLSCSYSV